MEHFSTEIAQELKDWPLEQRQEAGSAIAELEQMPGWEIVVDLAERVRRRKLAALLVDTKPREAAEYARNIGEINGIEIAQAIVSTVSEKARQADKELEQRLAGAAAEAR